MNHFEDLLNFWEKFYKSIRFCELKSLSIDGVTNCNIDDETLHSLSEIEKLVVSLFDNSIVQKDFFVKISKLQNVKHFGLSFDEKIFELEIFEPLTKMKFESFDLYLNPLLKKGSDCWNWVQRMLTNRKFKSLRLDLESPLFFEQPNLEIHAHKIWCTTSEYKFLRHNSIVCGSGRPSMSEGFSKYIRSNGSTTKACCLLSSIRANPKSRLKLARIEKVLKRNQRMHDQVRRIVISLLCRKNLSKSIFMSLNKDLIKIICKMIWESRTEIDTWTN